MIGFLQLRMATDSGDSVPNPSSVNTLLSSFSSLVYPSTEGLACACNNNDRRLFRGASRR